MTAKPTADATTEVVSLPHGEETHIAVDIEVPDEIADECRNGDGEIDMDELTDRIIIRTDRDP